MKLESRAPLIVAIVLLLPVLYVGSYLALVQPIADDDTYPGNYRFASSTCCRIFWPLEQIDRKLRPGSWGSRSFRSIYEPSIQQ